MRRVNVGVLGSGVVGRVLAAGFMSLGHEVKIGSRTPEKLHDWIESTGGRVTAGSFTEATQFGDLLVLATLGSGTESAIHLAGHSHFAGKVVIDATNPLDFSVGMPPRLFVGTTDSLGEMIQRWLPDAKIVKAFNSVGSGLMVNPNLPGGPPSMFIAGNDDDAKKVVSQVCDAFGWEAIDCGGIEGSRYLEPLCLVWVIHGIRTGRWTHAFKILHG